MLSPGKWHLQVPKEPRANLIFRRKLLQRCKNDPRAQAAIRHACQEDILFFINCFVWQYNPVHINEEIGPFITWDFQDAALLGTLERLFQDRGDMLWEKSRELGATWLALILWDWFCLFHSWKKFLCISHSEIAVDRPDDNDSLFWKLEFMHTHIPDWITRGVHKKKMGFHYKGTHSNLNGAASTERSGVGGRAASVLLDEFSKHKQDREILGQTADTGPRLIIGTHYGLGTEFYDLTQRPDMRKIIMHWSQHPEKNKGLYRYHDSTNKIEIIDKQYVFPEDYHFVMDGSPTGGPYPGLRSPWYDKECLRRASARDVAMHLDINPSGSVSQFFSPLTIRNLILTYACEPYWEGDIDYDRATGRPYGLVASPGGPLKLWCRLNTRNRPPLAPYGAGVDLSAGEGATPTCMSITNALTGEKVAEYTNAFIRPDAFAYVAVALCWMFVGPSGDGAKLGWESPGPGGTFGKKVVELGYRHVYYREREDKLTQEVTTTLGWYPGPDAKRIMLEEYRGALDRREYLNRSEQALLECLAFRYGKRGQIEHGSDQNMSDPTRAGTNHADHAIADGLSWKMCRSLGVRQVQVEESKVPQVGSLAWRRLLAHNVEQQEQEIA